MHEPISYSTIGEEREKIYYHLTHSLSSVITFEFSECTLNVRTFTDTMMSYSSHPFTYIAEDYYPLERYLVISDSEHLKFFKSLLKRKKATIGFQCDDKNIYLFYEYDSLKKVEGEGKRKKCKETGKFLLGEFLLKEQLPDNVRLAINCSERESDFAQNHGDILPQLLIELEIGFSKFEFDVISISGILINKNDVAKILSMFGKCLNFLYFSYDSSTRIAVFDSPESFLTVYNTTVEKYN